MENKRNHGVDGQGRSKRRIVVRSLAIAATSGCLALAGFTIGKPSADAQAPLAQVQTGGYKLPEKSYVTKNIFYLPVIVDEKQRASIKEIRLYVKAGPTAPWQAQPPAPPSQKEFECRLGGDGEYWFNLVTIDHAGVATPADVNKEPPAVIVVLDTSAPQVDLKPLPLNPDGICVRCDVKDANPNPQQTKFEYQDGNKMWRLLDCMPNQADCFCIPRQAIFSGMVKVTCTDRAMNTTIREFNIQQTSAAAPVQEPSPITKVNYEPEPVKTLTLPPPQHMAASSGNAVEQTKPINNSQDKPKDLLLPVPDLKVSGEPPLQPVQANPAVTQKTKSSGAKWMMVNQPRISLDYAIEDEGKSGIGKVEIWITKDNGRSWDVLCDDPDKKSPAVFDLPGEGVHGIRLSVTNGRGFGATPPKSGDAPDYVVELDSTKPVADLRSVKLNPSGDGACIDITWHASDKNLGNSPIDLYYRTSLDGQWTPIAKGCANTGKYQWFPPQEIGRQAYVRMVVSDMAGNSVRCDFAEAVALDDGTRPKATITGIVVIPSTGPGGN